MTGRACRTVDKRKDRVQSKKPQLLTAAIYAKRLRFLCGIITSQVLK